MLMFRNKLQSVTHSIHTEKVKTLKLLITRIKAESMNKAFQMIFMSSGPRAAQLVDFYNQVILKKKPQSA